MAVGGATCSTTSSQTGRVAVVPARVRRIAGSGAKHAVPEDARARRAASAVRLFADLSEQSLAPVPGNYAPSGVVEVQIGCIQGRRRREVAPRNDEWNTRDAALHNAPPAARRPMHRSTHMTMKRRDFICASAAMALVPLSALAKTSAALETWLYETVSRDPGPRAPLEIGNLTSEQYSSLYAVFERIGERWDMKAAGGIEESQFREFVEAKTSQAPSYLVEYAATVEIINVMARELGTTTAAIDRLLSPPDVPEARAQTRFGRAHTYVSAEFTAWYVTQGGFRRFGYHNYRGFIAGPFTMAPPPYRIARINF